MTPTAGIYVHNDGNNESTRMLYDTIEQLLRKADFPTRRNGCLCDVDDQSELEELVFLHPGDDNYCWNDIRRVIAEHPQTEFYIFGLPGSGRREGIGEHENVEFVGYRATERVIEIRDQYQINED